MKYWENLSNIYLESIHDNELYIYENNFLMALFNMLKTLFENLKILPDFLGTSYDSISYFLFILKKWILVNEVDFLRYS